MRRERRYKIILIDERKLVDIFNAGSNWPEYITFAKHPSIPDDCEVVSVYYNHAWRGLEVCVYHDSFPVASDCCELQRIGVCSDIEVWRRVGYEPVSEFPKCHKSATNREI